MKLTKQEKAHFTVVFEGNLREFMGNPFKVTETIFGKPYAVGYGNAFEKIDELEEALHSNWAALNTGDE